jgi:1-deoxy-D-xylulose-5-phosphate reductoisomerase
MKNKMIEKIAILGSTGSIGKSTLEVIAQHPERFEVIALAARTQCSEMIRQVKQFKPLVVSMGNKEAAEHVKSEIDSNIQVLWGENGLIEVATHPCATFLISALVGNCGLEPTLAAIQAGKKIGLANKEILVTAGHIVIQELQKTKNPLLPIDSEHSAIFQCLNAERREDITKIMLTASGGAFREWAYEDLKKATVEEALKHPNWSMGAKITIDSATMMNKGFEVIEAHWLFNIPYDQIEVLLHPQSIVHSMVEFQDGSVMAQLGTPDMKVPIQYALSYPERLPLKTAKLDFKNLCNLQFKEPDLRQYPCLKMALQAGRIGGTMPTVLNAANEVAVACFLKKECSFLSIERIVEYCLQKHQPVVDPSLDDIKEIDLSTRELANNYVSKGCTIIRW